LRHKKKQRQAN